MTLKQKFVLIALALTCGATLQSKAGAWYSPAYEPNVVYWVPESTLDFIQQSRSGPDPYRLFRPIQLYPTSMPTLLAASEATTPSAGSPTLEVEELSRKRPKMESTRGAANYPNLAITFKSLGSQGRWKQTFLRRGEITMIPDGLSGAYSAFSQSWSFSLTHGDEPFPEPDSESNVLVPITWKLSNRDLSESVELTETLDEANLRNRGGRTIACKVLQDALLSSVAKLEALETDASQSHLVLLNRLKWYAATDRKYSHCLAYFGLYQKDVIETHETASDDSDEEES